MRQRMRIRITQCDMETGKAETRGLMEHGIEQVGTGERGHKSTWKMAGLVCLVSLVDVVCS